ncbi:unnamed protein product [Adineta steineri]|uniref:Uncharacterized protein n=1 Tax=Adineta steineri TaxID=433720 RepID=A0A815R6E6_9BILA|nr:unnamed protein product [Adineta steineri]
MAASGQDTPHNKFSQSGPISHLSSSSPRIKTRSNSVSNDLEPEQKSSSDGTTTTTTVSKKIDFEEIRKKFDTPTTLEKPRPHGYPKRTSIPTMPTSQINTRKLTHTSLSKPNTSSDVNATTSTSSIQPLLVKPSVFPRAKSESPHPFSHEKNDSVLHKALRISMKNVQDNRLDSSFEEQECISSPLPDSSDSSLANESNQSEQPKSVSKIREFFDTRENRHVYQLVPRKSKTPLANKLQSPDFKEHTHQPPVRPPPRPDKYLKSQLNGWHSIPPFDPTDSSLSSNVNLSRCNSSDEFSDEEIDYEAERRTKLRRCLEEVHTTEKTFVNILYVLSVKLTVEVKNTCEKDENLILTFNNTYKPLLGTIQQIYGLHNGHILPEIEDHIAKDSTGNMWSVLEKNAKVIEVLYKNYYVTYNETQGKLEDLCKNFPLINEAMLKCQVYLGNLYPTSQLNVPNQRLVRYILCMKTYMKYLDENSDEYKYTRCIHDELDRIAGRCEEELVISSAQLNELKERLDNKFECIKDHRKLLWHGSLKKQSPRKHLQIVQRYMILFSDCILVCSEESGRKLDVKRELTMRDITVDVIQHGRTSFIPSSDQQNTGTTYYPFRVNAVEKSYEFLVDKEAEREIWVKKIRQASDAYNKRNIEIEVRSSTRRSEGQQLGVRAPAWVNDLDVTRCQICNNRFPPTFLGSRRHHCRCCGRCICGSCSTKKLTLEYCKNDGDVRICDTCYTHFTGTVLSKNSSIWPKATREIDETILFGDFRAVNSGTTIWIALQEDYQLHIYGARLDQAEDYSIKLPDLLELQLDEDTRIFTLRETTKTHIFCLDTKHQINYQKNDSIDEKIKNSTNKLKCYTDLWFEAMQLAQSTSLPVWYIRKRDSADSGVSNIG